MNTPEEIAWFLTGIAAAFAPCAVILTILLGRLRLAEDALTLSEYERELLRIMLRNERLRKPSTTTTEGEGC